MNWSGFFRPKVNAAVLCFAVGLIGLFFIPSLKFYEILLINLGEVIMLASIVYFFKHKSIYDELFYNLKLYVNDSYPLFLDKKDSLYRFVLPVGLSAQKFKDVAATIQEFRGREIKINYAYDDENNRGLVLIKEFVQIGNRINVYEPVYWISMLIGITAVIVTDYFILKLDISAGSLFHSFYN